MADLKHITRINDTRANLLANLDVHQSSIATDNNSNGYKGYSWKDGAGNLLEAAAINKDVSFVDITATGDVFVSAFTAAGIVKNAATTGLLIGGNLVENTDFAILGTSGTLAKFGSTGLVVSKLIESGVMMGFNLTPYSGNVAASIGSLFEIDAKDGYGDIQLINYGNNFGIAKNLYFNDTPSTDTWRLKTSANASLLLFIVDSLYYYGQASGTAGAVAALKEVFYASPSTGFHVNSAAQVTAGYFTVSSTSIPYAFNVSFATGLSEFNGNVLLTTTNQTRYRDTATYISSKNANCLDIDAASQVRVNSGYLQTIATVAGTTGVWNEVVNNVQSGIVKDDVSGGYRVYGRDNTTNLALLSEISTIHNTIPAGASDLNPRLEFRLYDYPGGLVTWMTLLNDGSITLSKYGAGIAHFSAAGSISSSAVVNVDFGNLGTAGTIPKFAANGLAASIITETAAGVQVGIGHDIYFDVNSGQLVYRVDENGTQYGNKNGLAHGITDVVWTDVWGCKTPVSTTYGGCSLIGVSNNAGYTGLALSGYIGSTDPTDTVPALKLLGAKKGAGTAAAALGSAETVFQLLNYTTQMAAFTGDGHFKISGCFAQIYVHDGSVAQDIVGTSTYNKITAFATNGESSILTADVANDKIILTKPGKYFVTFNASFTSAENNVVFSGVLFLNGVEQTMVHSRDKKLTGTDVASVSAFGIIDCTAANYDLDLRIKHGSADPTTIAITIVYGGINAVYLGET